MAIHHIQPQYPQMLPKRKKPWEDFFPALAHALSSGLIQQAMWKEREGIRSKAEGEKRILKRQEHFEDLGHPTYDPMKEPMEAWGPEVKKVGEKYYGEPTPKITEIPGLKGRLLDYKGKTEFIQPKEEKVPKIDKVDLDDKVQVWKDGELWKTYEKGEAPGKGDKTTVSKVLPSGLVNTVPNVDRSELKKWETRGYNEGTLKEMKEKDLTKDKAWARKRISEIEAKFAQLKTKGVTAEILVGLPPQLQGLLGAVKGQSLSKGDLDRIAEVFEKEIQALIDAYDLEEYIKPQTTGAEISGADAYINKVLGRPDVDDWRKYQ